jgi:hypothetical protein
MAMYKCKKCLENSWSFVPLPDNFVKATCNLCGYEKLLEKRQVKQAGDDCGNCDGALFLGKARFLTTKRLKKRFHYCHSLHCNKCSTVYLLDEWKRKPGEKCDCPRKDEEDKVEQSTFKYLKDL